MRRIIPGRAELAPAAGAERPDRPLLGVLSIEFAVLVFAFQDVIIKLLSGSYSVWQIVFVRGVVALVPLLAAAAAGGAFRTLGTRRLGMHVIRGLVGFACYTFYYLGMAVMPVVDVAAIYYSTPLFITVMSIFLLGERVGVYRGLAVVVGFVGVIIMLKPGIGMFHYAALLPLVAAVLYAGFAIITRRLGRTESTLAITVYSTAVFVVCGAVGSALVGALLPDRGGGGSYAFLVRAWIVPDAADLLLMGLLGLIAAAGFFGITQAYRVAPASVVAPFDYSFLVWVALLGYAVWGDIPASHTLAGIMLVVGGGLFIVLREAWRKPESKQPVSRDAATFR